MQTDASQKGTNAHEFTIISRYWILVHVYASGRVAAAVFLMSLRFLIQCKLSRQAPPKRWSRSSFRATCAQQSAQSPAPCKQSTSTFSRVVWIGDEFGALLTLENKREERVKQRKEEEKTWNSTSHFNWRELWWNGKSQENRNILSQKHHVCWTVSSFGHEVYIGGQEVGKNMKTTGTPEVNLTGFVWIHLPLTRKLSAQQLHLKARWRESNALVADATSYHQIYQIFQGISGVHGG